MKLKFPIETRKRLNDKGFSLVELLISIAILVIIMVPLMGNFIRSMQMNKRAEKYQIQSNLAASVMEGLKVLRTKEIIDEFNGPKARFSIIPNDFNDFMRLVPNGTDEYKRIEENIDHEQATDYYAIHGVIAGGFIYDVFIKLDAATDIYKLEADDLNNYPMPEIVNLDKEANSLLFSDGSSLYQANESNPDLMVLASFTEQGEAYAHASLLNHPTYLNYLNDYARWLDAMEEAEMGGPTPSPMYDAPTLESLGLDVYTKEENIKKHVTKNMRITVDDTNILYEVEYICDWWAPIKIIRNIDRVEYASTVENIYIFYYQSIFHSAHSHLDNFTADKIYILNNNADNKVNFFVADQNNTTLNNPILIESPTDGSIKVFTNISDYVANADDAPINDSLINTYELNRIFDITIDICKAEIEESNRYKEVYYSLKSTKER